jgi:hypothetical protein
MRRRLAILKYVPAVLCGLLVVAWVVSPFWYLWIDFGCCHRIIAMHICRGALDIQCEGSTHQLGTIIDSGFNRDVWDVLRNFTGWILVDSDRKFLRIVLPFSLLISLAFPFALAPFTRFRFPLWSYFAWIGLLAAELAYYLR